MRNANDFRASPYLVAAFRILWNERARELFEVAERSWLSEESFFASAWEPSDSMSGIDSSVFSEIRERVASVAFELENLENGGFLALDCRNPRFLFPNSFPAVSFVMWNFALLDSAHQKFSMPLGEGAQGVVIFSERQVKAFQGGYPDRKGVLILDSVQRALRYLRTFHAKITAWDLAIVALEASETKAPTTSDKIVQMITESSSTKTLPRSGKSVFVSWSMSIASLPDLVMKWLDRIIEKGDRILVWDAGGIDTLIQQYLANAGYHNVVVHTVYDKPRNIASHKFETDCLDLPAPITREKQSEKDSRMTHSSDVSFVIWDGKSAGSFQNAIRWISEGKDVQIYLAPESRYLKESELNKEKISEIYENLHEYSLSEYLDLSKDRLPRGMKTPWELKRVLQETGVIDWERPSPEYSKKISVTLNRGKVMMKFPKSLLDGIFVASAKNVPETTFEQPQLF